MKNRFAALLCLLLLPGPVRAQFREDAWGARSLALGGAYRGVRGDASSQFWNPAALTYVNGNDFVASYGQLVSRAGTNPQSLYSGAYVYNSTDTIGAFGIGWSNYVLKDINAENTFSLSFSRPVFVSSTWGELSAGLSLKYLRYSFLSQSLEDQTDLSSDLGLMWTPFRKLSIGAAIRNVNNPQVGGLNNGSLDSNSGIGASYWLENNTMLTVDAPYDTRDNSVGIRGGLEQWFLHHRVALRVGANSEHSSYGIAVKGLDWHGVRVRFEYTYAQPYDLSHYDRIHLGSLRIEFGASQSSAAATAASAVETAKSEPPVQHPSKPADMDKAIRDAQGKLEFLLGPDDIVSVSVKDHPELDLTATVDAWGQLKFPYIGDTTVKGMSPGKLQETLTKIYSDFYVQPPVVEVTVKEYNSRVVYVLGAVKTPGKYPLKEKPVKLSEVMYLAGLPNGSAAVWRTFVIRQTDHGPVYLHVNLYEVMWRGHLEKDIQLQTGDIIYVPMTLLNTFINFVSGIFSPFFGVSRSIAGLATF